ncbi:MAG TPA: zinc transporter [Desulfobacteraceae bacterium]|nr:zinc transporter [Desulfobacteraceae bacterium]
MSHDHTHDHDHEHSHAHTHTHSHDHGHSHSHGGEMSMEDKLATLFAHWIDHNDSHMDNFVSWADKARAAGFDDVAASLEEAGRLSGDVTGKLKEARDRLNATAG